MKKLGNGVGSANGSSVYDKHIPHLTNEAAAAFVHPIAKNTLKHFLCYYKESNKKEAYEALENAWFEISCLYSESGSNIKTDL